MKNMFLNLKKLQKAKKCFTTSAAFIGLGLMLTEPAHAQGGFKSLFDNVFVEQFRSGADMLGTIAYIAGAFIGARGFFKLKEWNDSKGRDVTLTQALIPFAIAGGLLGLPTILKASKETTTGTGQQGTSIGTGSAIRSIN